MFGVTTIQNNNNNNTSVNNYSKFEYHMAEYSTIGKIVLASALAIFVYFTFWISILPFVRIENGMLNDTHTPKRKNTFADVFAVHIL